MEKDFIREKIKKKPPSGREILKKILYIAAAAVLFGVIAGISFVLTSHKAEQHLVPTETSETLCVPKDEPEETCAPETKPESGTDSAANGTEDTDESSTEETEPLSLGIAEYEMLHESVTEVISQVKRGLVTVTTMKKNVDWFNREYTTEGEVAGAITAITGKDIYVLFRGDVLKDSEALEITFWEGTTLPAVIKGTDSVTGIAVAAVDKTLVTGTLLDEIQELVLGNSYRTHLGETVLAGGSPYGSMGSIGVGMVVYIEDDVPWVDGTIRVIYTDMGLLNNAGGFMFNLKGEIIGMFTKDFSGSENSLTRILSISNLKAVLEHIYNGTDMGMLGIKGGTVTEKIATAEEMPMGVYVMEVLEDSPAFAAGMQAGDVITGFAGEPLHTLKELQDFLERPLKEEETAFTVMRSGVTEWEKVSFSIPLQSRQTQE